jgi:hypothetical protein
MKINDIINEATTKKADKKYVKATSWDVLPNYLAKNYPNVNLVNGWRMDGKIDGTDGNTIVSPIEFQDGRWPGEESSLTNNDPEAHDAVISAIKYVTPSVLRNQIGTNNNLYFEIKRSTIPGSVVAGYVTLVDKAEADEDIPSIIEFTVNMNGKTVGKHTTETDRWGFDPSVEYDALHDAIKLFKRTENKTINVQDGGRNILWSFDTPSNIKKAMDDGEEDYNIEEGENWSKHNNKRVGGMSKKSVKSYRRSHPGSKIQTAVTTKPSKIKKGSKDAKRRKSFCARMKGMKKHRTSAKTARDPNSNINKSLRRWNCESIEQMEQLVMLAEQFIRKAKS